MKWMALFGCCLLVAAPAVAQKNGFKAFFKEGLDLFEQKQYAAALPKFAEAYRLEPEAQRYKLEGTFFADYLPRYRIALCHEGMGSVLEAEEWINKSKEALEENVLKRRNDTADYHAAASRILDRAKDYRANLTARYDAALKDANDLLASHRFEDARRAFEQLKTIDPSRQDANMGLSRIKQDRDNYLKGLVLDARTALVGKDFARAAGTVDAIESFDRLYPDIPILRREIEAARKAAATVVAESNPPEIKKDPDTPPKTETKPPPKKDPDPEVIRRSAEAEAAKRREQSKREMRAALLATLRPYRQGEPEKALAQLQKITPEQGSEWGSYHWLKGVYLLAAHRYSASPDQSMVEQARVAMKEVHGLMPRFEPDSTLYPAYIIDFYNAAN